MTKKREVKTVPAGIKDNVNITCTYFASDRENLRTGNGREFDNDELLRSFGFKESADGTMRMGAYDNDYINLDEKNGKLKRVVKGEIASVANVAKDKIERMISQGKAIKSKSNSKSEVKEESVR